MTNKEREKMIMMSKEKKYKLRRSVLSVLLIVMFVGSGFLLGKNFQVKSNILENEKVRIELLDVKNGDFDIIIESKKDFNISPEWNLESEKYYKEAYLVGKTKNNAMKFYKKNEDRFTFPFSWNQ